MLLSRRLGLALLLSGACSAATTACHVTSSSSDDGANGGAALGAAVCPASLQQCASTVTFADHGESSVEVRGDFGGQATWESGVAMQKQAGVWRAELQVPFGKPVLYKLVVNGTDWIVDQEAPTITDASGNQNNTLAATTCDAVLCQEPAPPARGVFDWRDAVVYFAFVDRFLDGDPTLDPGCHVQGVSGNSADYQGGDWAGVTQKINEGYFNDLGVNTLWITVPSQNPDSAGKGVGGDDHLYSGYHGYWPKLDNADPTHLDHERCFGSFDDLKGLVSAAHAKGLKVLFDYAMVHVHAASGIYQQHPDWFWPNSKDGSGDCICGQSCSWDTDAQRCWFTDYLPHWDYTNEGARSWSVANAVAWVRQTGVDGFRADAIKHVDASWMNALRAKIATDVTATQQVPQRFYMVGETYDFFNRGFLKSFVDSSSKLDGQFDFPLRRNVVESMLLRSMSLSDLAAFMDSNDFYYGSDAVMSTFIGNHDLPRIIHLAANQPLWGTNDFADGKDRAWQNQPGPVAEREAYERVANAFAVLFTNRGAPLVYYGDEIGLPGAGDPDNRRPMQWSGLSDNQSFLQDQMKKLGTIRSQHPALRRGARTTLSVTADTWAYVRDSGEEKVYVALNRSDAPQAVLGLPGGDMVDLLTGEIVTGPSPTIPPRRTRILVAR